MLLVPTRIEASPIHGLGLFATAPIPAGTVWWRFDGRVDREYSDAEIEALPEPMQRHLVHYAYRLRSGVVIHCGDNARFVNHADTPNSREGEGGCSIAARDIAAGEEITEDYGSFVKHIA